MFGHLDDPRPAPPGPEARVAVAVRAARARRRRRVVRSVGAGLAVLAVLVVLGNVLPGPSEPTTAESAYQFDRTAVVPAGGPVPTSALEDVVFVDATHGFALADHRSGLVLASSSDGGATWQVVSDDLPYPYLGSGQVQMEFIDSAHGYLWDPTGAAGAQPLWRTDDGGRQWVQAPLGGAVVDVSAIGADVWALTDDCPRAFTAGCTAQVEASADSGATWTDAGPVPVGPGTLELARITVSRAYVLSAPGGAGPGSLAFTADGGATWSARPVPCTSQSGAELAASGTDDLWLLCGGQPSAGNQAKEVFRSSDGGSTWGLAARVPGPDSAAAPVGSLPALGYVAPVALGHKTLAVASPSLAWLQPDRGGVLVTHDGGVTWEPVADLAAAGFGTGAPGNLTFISAARGWVCELGVGLWRTTDGQHWEAMGP